MQTTRKHAIFARRWPARVAAVIAAALVAACGQPAPDKLMASARDYIAKKDYNAAAIQLKNVLQKQPNDAEARYLIGVALLELSDGQGAEQQLRKALELGFGAEPIYPLLARAMLEAGRPDRVLAEMADKTVANAAGQADLHVSLGNAYLSQAKPKEARQQFAAALKLKADHDGARVGEARLLAADGDGERALRVLDAVLARSESHEALFLKGELLAAKGEAESAVPLLEKAVRARPLFWPARQSLIALQTHRQTFDAAQASIDQAKRIFRNEPQLVFLEATLALRQEKYGAARNLIQQILKDAPDHVQSLVLAGTIELQSGSYGFAEEFFRKALYRAPEHAGARRLLVASYVRGNQPDRALEALQPLLDRGGSDAGLAMLAGEVYLAKNDLKAAAKYFERAAADPQAPPAIGGANARTRLAQVRLASGDVTRALAELEAIARTDATQHQADVMLVSTYLQRGERDKALAAARQLERKQPDNALSHQLLASVHLANRDAASARASLERALQRQAGSVPALQGLAQLDHAEGKLGEARKRFDEVLAREPTNAAVLLAYSAFLGSAGAEAQEIAALLERAVRANPSNADARAALVDAHLRAADARKALQAAQEASTALPNNLRIMELLGLAQQASGNVNQAIETMRQLTLQSPKSVVPLIRLAGAFAAAREFDRAAQTMRRALQIEPHRMDVQRDLVSFLAQAGHIDEALKEARSVQRSRPKEAAGFAMEGDVLAVQKRWLEAAGLYRAGLARSPDAAVGLKFHGALANAGETREAMTLAERWIKENPNDAAVRVYLAEREARAKNYKGAAQHYRALVAHQPNSAALLNNLAWTAAQGGDPDALKYAESAYRLAPANASVVDTLGWLLLERGDTTRAVELLRKAVSLAPSATEIRLHLAKALLKSGSTEAARKELEAIVGATATSTYKDEAAALLKTL
jgi:putative PEP-CTERM system TPR-repeat lipoprotein